MNTRNHGGKRKGAGRPSVNHVVKKVSLEQRQIDLVHSLEGRDFSQKLGAIIDEREMLISQSKDMR